MRIFSEAILIFMITMFVGVVMAGCIVTTSVNIGHHQEFSKQTDIDDAELEQGYETNLGKGR